MKVLVVSDSHGMTTELEALKEAHHGVDVMIHCGDSELPFDHPSLDDFHVVKGNCDFDRRLPNDLVLNNQNVTFYITHGHLYHVKMSLLNLSYRAKEVGADIVCYGHSHIAGVESIDGTIFVNPGSMLLPRLRKEKTYAILEIENKKVIVKFYDLQKNTILDNVAFSLT